MPQEPKAEDTSGPKFYFNSWSFEADDKKRNYFVPTQDHRVCPISNPS